MQRFKNKVPCVQSRVAPPPAAPALRPCSSPRGRDAQIPSAIRAEQSERERGREGVRTEQSKETVGIVRVCMRVYV